eukprot:TRINITY_DN13026_c0_g1_i1.p1 TRINITY_DN13026_c0_g1~~TRINITY_DN13026_c0_g1_i1.p1  ORF type:complete len:256 (-),score=25.53 TRINITY_DN13026_c0_g1_i1:230-997(-)
MPHGRPADWSLHTQYSPQQTQDQWKKRVFDEERAVSRVANGDAHKKLPGGRYGSRFGPSDCQWLPDYVKGMTQTNPHPQKHVLQRLGTPALRSDLEPVDDETPSESTGVSSYNPPAMHIQQSGTVHELDHHAVRQVARQQRHRLQQRTVRLRPRLHESIAEEYRQQAADLKDILGLPQSVDFVEDDPSRSDSQESSRGDSYTKLASAPTYRRVARISDAVTKEKERQKAQADSMRQWNLISSAESKLRPPRNRYF